MTRAERILIFQIGSLGDTVISMPCYREIPRRHPDSERLLLTNFPIGSKMVQAEAMLSPCGLIHGCIEYPMPLRGMVDIRALYKRLRAAKVDILYYLVPEKRVANLLRHFAFLRACGIRDLRGLPWTRDLRLPREIVPGTLWESEASRLLRTIGSQSLPAAPDPADRSLNLTPDEYEAADRLLAEAPTLGEFVAVSVGGKVPINNWGDENWRHVLRRLQQQLPDVGVVFLGSADERQRNEELARACEGPTLNSCGRLTPRQTAALIARAKLFLGHDTGTLHLAAAVGTRIVGVYSARNVPGKWYSDRAGDQFFYEKPPCFGCELEVSAACPYGVVCMTSHNPERIVNIATEALSHA